MIECPSCGAKHPRGGLLPVVLVLSALVALGLAGCAHRDIKPANVDPFYRADAGVETDPCGRVYP